VSRLGQLIATNHHDLVSLQELLGNNRSQAPYQVVTSVNDNDLKR
jgi:hypothetical protein